MTDQSRPDEPRTEAGRALLARISLWPRRIWREAILAVEAEASSAGVATLDVETLAEAWGNVMDGRRICDVRLDSGATTSDDWEKIAAEYVRLAEGTER